MVLSALDRAPGGRRARRLVPRTPKTSQEGVS
jgi:hypothetical protein